MASRTDHQTPEWETPLPSQHKNHHLLLAKVNPFATKQAQSASSVSDKERLEQAAGAAPAKRSSAERWILVGYFNHMGRSRKAVLCGFAALILFIALILGLGLGLGLSKRKHSASDLPLPSNKAIFTGDLTYYSPGPGYGACGYENTSNDAICAVSHIVFDAASTSSNSNDNPLCGKMIRITRYDESKGGNSSVDVEVVDRCTGCKETDLDLSLAMFESLAEEAEGRVVGSWAWLD